MSAHEAHHGHQHEAGEAEDPSVRWTAEFWDERYGSSPALWSGHVNAVVMTETESLPPGTALDVGCGEGGDALWLAGRGWQVEGVDVSQVALDRAARHAAAAGAEAEGRLTWTKRDLMSWRPPERAYDLVTVSFMHLPGGDRRAVYAGLADAVVVGGTFLVGAHSPLDIGVVPRPDDPDLYFTAEELAAGLDDRWEILTSEERPRPGRHPEGGAVTLHDTVLRARRLR
ncbi:bifunctional 2-polyprenyl-6-hydroxyphenol methylase/3-demethylubiquinol 3-O-methyltransferase UbiG [Marmoricola sp. URHB0036]|uniref:class I SAM-dependent methyltransferase n=1 Tax=Marmoricola sp. URHB0036 TaxID=1298863 RepID=UPI00040CB23C|nr:class I SAM-dependent methyltransferase [Marmoricola sp. URHB0036]